MNECDQTYTSMYNAGRNGKFFNRPFEGKNKEKFDAWMMGYLDGLGDGKHQIPAQDYKGLIARLNRSDYKEWGERWISYIPG